MKKTRPWHFWIVVLFVTFMYAMGIYDMPMMLTHNAGYYASHGYGRAVADYFENYPLPLLALWGTNLVTGFLAPLVLVFSARIAKHLALTSALADTALLLLTFVFRDRLAVLGVNIAMFDLFILAMTIAFFFYCRMNERILGYGD